MILAAVETIQSTVMESQGGSPGGQPDGSPQGTFSGADVALRMVQAAESAAAAATAAQNLLSRHGGEESKSWWKLLPKPPVFDHGSREAEISAWRERSWSFERTRSLLKTFKQCGRIWTMLWTQWIFQMQRSSATLFSTACLPRC